MAFSKTLYLLILIILLVCVAEARRERPSWSRRSSAGDVMTRRKRFFFSCPDLKFICPTKKQHFTVHSKWRGLGCKLQGSVLDIALKECDNGIMEQCKDKWKNKNNKCSVPVIVLKQIIDHVFHPACTLHDLCYASLNADQDDCDRWFYHNLKQICSMKKLTRIFCRGSAYAVHKAVRIFGKKFFNRGQDWANENCTAASTNPPTPTTPSNPPTPSNPTVNASVENTASPKSIIVEGESGSGSGHSGSRIVPVVPILNPDHDLHPDLDPDLYPDSGLDLDPDLHTDSISEITKNSYQFH